VCSFGASLAIDRIVADPFGGSSIVRVIGQQKKKDSQIFLGARRYCDYDYERYCDRATTDCGNGHEFKKLYDINRNRIDFVR